MSRFLSFMVAILLLVGVSAMGTPSAQASAPDSASKQVAGNAQTTCKHMSRTKARTVFTHLDGTPTKFSEWSIVDHKTLLHVEGIGATGKDPRDQMIDESGVFYALEGKVFTTVNNHAFTVQCIPNPGTKHVSDPPKRCPVGVDQLVKQLKGKDKNWTTPSMGPDYYSWGMFSRNQFVRKPAHYKLPAFTVPFQGRVTDLNTGVEYTPGYRVPRTNFLIIYCY